jgi:small GTP-binding protein
MGTTISRAISAYKEKNTRRVTIVGLDSAGKTTVLYFMRYNKATSTVPTTDCLVESIRFHTATLQLWDCGGQDSLRPYWRHYMSGSHGVIFVVDSADRARVEAMQEEFSTVVQDPQLAHAAILVLANKQDIPGHMGQDEVAELLGVAGACTAQQRWAVQPAVARTGEGLEDGFTWLCANMRPFR